jgi:hypothetical protein
MGAGQSLVGIPLLALCRVRPPPPGLLTCQKVCDGNSVQLAAAHQLQETKKHSLTFASYGRRLNRSAQLLQLEVLG